MNTPTRREQLFVGLYAIVITLTVQGFVGSQTLYKKDYEQARLLLHHAILTNTPPEPGGWSSLGANATSVRILIVYLADTVSRATGAGVLGVYRIIDHVCLSAALFLLFLLLRNRFTATWAWIGLSLFAIPLPLTMMFHYFHPWDRPSLVIWVAMLMAIQKRNPSLLALMLVAGMPIKFDAAVAPALYFLTTVNRGNWRKQAVITLGLLALSFGILMLLTALYPGSAGKLDRLALFRDNLRRLVDVTHPHPAIVGLGPLLALGLLGWPRADQFTKACLVFAIMLLPMFLFVRLEELRAMTMILLMLLPAAVRGAMRLLEPGSQTIIGRHS